jgi:hypothetical protein
MIQMLFKEFALISGNFTIQHLLQHFHAGTLGAVWLQEGVGRIAHTLDLL